MVNLSVELAPENSIGLKLVNPVMTASGTFGYGTECSELCDIQKLGAIVCKATTLKERGGNPQPRLAEVDSGLLNAIGLQNIGVERVIKEKAPVWAGWKVPVIVNIAAEAIDDYAEIASKLSGVGGISALELNISCPNVSAGCIEFGTDPEQAAEVTSAVKAATTLPLIVKLTPNTSDIVAVAQAVVSAGADAVSLINTLKGMSIDIAKRRPTLGNLTGGLSGPVIKPVALAMVYQVVGAVEVPVIGCGGISTVEDAIEFIMAGASAVQVGTACLINPKAPLEILKDIEKFMADEGISDIKELVGVARR